MGGGSGGREAPRDWKASDAMAIARGRVVSFRHDAGAAAEELRGMNRGKRGARYTIPDTTVALLAAAMTVAGLSYRALQGYAEAAAGAHVASYSQLHRRITSADIELVGSAARGAAALRLGGAEATVRRARGGVVVEARRLPRRRGAASVEFPGGGIAVIGTGRHAPEGGAIVDATFVAVGQRSTGRMEKWPREAAGRPNWRVTFAIGLRSRRVVAAAVTPDSVGDITALPHVARRLVSSGAAGRRPPRARRDVLLADGAYCSRRAVDCLHRMGIRLVSPMRLTSIRLSRGARGWAGTFDEQFARGARPVVPGRISRADRAARQKLWRSRSGYSRRSRVEAEFSAFKRVFGGHVAARRWENVVAEVARKVVVHNALVAAAGPSRRAPRGAAAG